MGFIDDLKDKVKDGITEVTEELGKQKASFSGLYIYGHPNVKGNNIGVWIVLYENELAVKQKMVEDNILFKLPYEKIESVNVLDSKKMDVSGFVPGVMRLFDGRKIKGVVLEIIALGKDKNNNIVKIPILFGDIRACLKLKTVLDNEIGKAQGITI
jgi:hypothetical protein